MSKNTDSPADNQALAASLEKTQMKYKPDQVNPALGDRKENLEDVEPRTTGVMDEQFPTASLTAYDKRDKEMAAKLQLATGSEVGYTPFGKLIAKDEDFQWYQKKQAAAEVANFEKWFANEFDMMDPVQKARAKELYPEFYRARKKLLKLQTKNLFNLARIKLEGISTFEDLKTIYLAETGRLDLGPLQNLLHPETDKDAAKYRSERFERGLVNPFLVFGKQAYPETRKKHADRAQYFAEREVSNQSTRLGYGKFGFPPFNANQSGQSDRAWFSVLSEGVAGLGGNAP